MKSYLLGIDVGTSNVKAVLFAGDGEEVYVASRDNDLICDGRCVEQDMDAVWQSVKDCVREIADNAGESGNNIVGIGVAGQGEGFWPIGEDGRPLQNAILWRDGRAFGIVDEIMEGDAEIGHLYHETTGCQPLPGNQMILLKWMALHRPDVLARCSRVLFCKDWIRYRMTGELVSEATDNYTSLMDVKTDRIADSLMKKLGVSGYRRLFGDPVASDECAGVILDSFADEMGLKRGIPVIAGAIDIAATTVGLGAIQEGDVCLILGTTCVGQATLSKDRCRFGTGNTRYEKHPLGDLYIDFQATLNGTSNIKWMLKHISDTGDFAKVDRKVANTPVGSRGVIYHPYLCVAGERAPFYHADARASFFGINETTCREDLMRAIYEGVGLSLRDCFMNLDAGNRLLLTGGGAKSPIWAQIIADILNREVMIPVGNEAGAKGIAMMAGVRFGLYKDYAEAVSTACHSKGKFRPDPDSARKYDLLFGLYQDMRINNQDMWKQRRRTYDMINGETV